MSRKEREDAVGRMRRGESWVMVTTEVMARGMDFKGVREVVNYDFPRSVQSYVHRIGASHPCLGLMVWRAYICDIRLGFSMQVEREEQAGKERQ